MIYVKSFQYSAPFKNKGLSQLCATFFIPYLTKELGFSIPESRQELNDVVCSYSTSFEKRTPDFRLGKYTLAGFGLTPQIGDNLEICSFYVMSLDKALVDKVITGAYEVCKKTIEEHGVEEDSFHIWNTIAETIFPLEGTVTKKFDYQQKVQKWESLIDDFPYGDKLYEWLLNNRHYPTVKPAD